MAVAAWTVLILGRGRWALALLELGFSLRCGFVALSYSWLCSKIDHRSFRLDEKKNSSHHVRSIPMWCLTLFLPIPFPEVPGRQLIVSHYLRGPPYLHFNAVGRGHLRHLIRMPEAGIEPGPPDRDGVNVVMRDWT